MTPGGDMQKLLIIFLSIFVSFSVYSTEVYLDKEEKTLIEELLDIKDLMVAVEDNLRDDRTDKVVQMKGQEVEDRLDKLIEEIDAYEKKHGREIGRKPMKDSKIDKSKVNERVWKTFVLERAPWMTKGYDDWAKLQPATRERILQSWSDEIPLRWQRRIMAYWMSVGAEEKKWEDAEKEKIRRQEMQMFRDIMEKITKAQEKKK
jgi:hypothetical protein